MSTTISVLVICEGPREAQYHDAREDLKISELVAQVSPASEDVFAFLADADEPLAAELTLVEHGIGADDEITIARRGTIEVTVRYGGEHRHAESPPNRRVKRVLQWALSKHGFNIPEVKHANFELADAATSKVVDLDSTIAQYVRDHRRQVVFDLREIDGQQG